MTKIIGCIWPEPKNIRKGIWDHCDVCKAADERACKSWRSSMHAIQITTTDYTNIMLSGYWVWVNHGDTQPVRKPSPPRRPSAILTEHGMERVGYDNDGGNDFGAPVKEGALA